MDLRVARVASHLHELTSKSSGCSIVTSFANFATFPSSNFRAGGRPSVSDAAQFVRGRHVTPESTQVWDKPDGVPRPSGVKGCARWRGRINPTWQAGQLRGRALYLMDRGCSALPKERLADEPVSRIRW